MLSGWSRAITHKWHLQRKDVAEWVKRKDSKTRWG